MFAARPIGEFSTKKPRIWRVSGSMISSAKFATAPPSSRFRIGAPLNLEFRYNISLL